MPCHERDFGSLNGVGVLHVPHMYMGGYLTAFITPKELGAMPLGIDHSIFLPQRNP